MNDLNRSYAYLSTESEKKGRKLKNHRTEDVCKCFPYVKLHHHDCPVVMKPCPIHGSNLHHSNKESNLTREQNVIISFHPSSKTEKLLQPIKSLLGHCNSETKINFQYYSRDSSINKESLKSQNGQNTYENIKKALNTNVFVERTKSFVASKTNKVKKLKQCFHSPCNSIAQKTFSQTSIKAKINQILREEKQTRNVFYNMVPDIPPNNKKFDPTTTWFYSNKGDFKSQDILPDEKIDSDFITVTQRDKNNAIHHKIYEIKHRKGLNDIPFVGFPKQPNTQLVYSTVNMTTGDGQLNAPTIQTNPKYTAQELHQNRGNEIPHEKSSRGWSPDTGENLEMSSSGITHRSYTSTSSSGSVYITPFIFVPKGVSENESKVKSIIDQLDEAIQVDEVKPKPSPKSSLIPEVQLKSTSIQASQEVILKNIYGPDSKTPSREVSYEKTISEITNLGSIGKAKDAEVQTSLLSHREAQTHDLIENNMLEADNKSTESGRNNTSKRLGEKEVQTMPDQNDCVELMELDLRKSFERQPSDQAMDKLAKTCWGKSHSDSELYEKTRCSCCKSENENLVLQCDLNQTSDLSHASGERATYTKVNAPECITRGLEPGNTRVKIVTTTREKIECFSETKPMPKRDEGTNAGVSDLTELKKIILDLFEKGNFTSKSSCKCLKEKQPASRNEPPNIIEKSLEKKDPTVQTSWVMDTKPEKKNAQIQTTDIGPERRNTSCQTSMQINVNLEKTEVQPGIQTRLNRRNEAEVQENVGVLLDEDESSHKIVPKNRRTVFVDENGIKTYFVCALCSRVIKISVNTETNTDCIETSAREKKTTSASPTVAEKSEEPRNETGSQCPRPTEKSEVRTESPPKKIKSAGVNTTQTKRFSKAAQPDERFEKSANLQNLSRGLQQERSRIPIPDLSSSRCTARITETSARSTTNWDSKQKMTTCATQASRIIRTEYRNCICEPSTSQSTGRPQKQQDVPHIPTPKGAEFQKKFIPSAPGREDAGERKPRPQKNKYGTIYPVIITSAWPKDFARICKSMESPTKYSTFGEAPDFRKTKQKRSYGKDLDVTAVGKKPKMGGEKSARKYISSGNIRFSDLLKVENPEIFQGSPSSMFSYWPTTPGDEKNSSGTEEQNPEESANGPTKNYPDLDEDLVPQSDHFSESNYTTENSFLEDNDEEDQAETPVEGDGDPKFVPQTSNQNLAPQSQSAVAFNRLIYANAATTSRSLNAIWFFVSSNGNKIRRKRHK